MKDCLQVYFFISDALSPEELEKVLGREITPLADALKELI